MTCWEDRPSAITTGLYVGHHLLQGRELMIPSNTNNSGDCDKTYRNHWNNRLSMCLEIAGSKIAVQGV